MIQYIYIFIYRIRCHFELWMWIALKRRRKIVLPASESTAISKAHWRSEKALRRRRKKARKAGRAQWEEASSYHLLIPFHLLLILLGTLWNLRIRSWQQQQQRQQLERSSAASCSRCSCSSSNIITLAWIMPSSCSIQLLLLQNGFCCLICHQIEEIQPASSPADLAREKENRFLSGGACEGRAMLLSTILFEKRGNFIQEEN